MFIEQAQSFAWSARRMASRLRWAQQTEKEIQQGPVYRRQVGDGINPGVKVELGCADRGRVYVEAGGVKITCDGQQTEDLLHALCRFADDVSAIQQVGGSAQPYQADIVPAARAALDAHLDQTLGSAR
jgi:hypothetical protein